MNCDGINNTDKRDKIFHYLQAKKLDIIFLQETFLFPEKNEIVSNHWRNISNGLSYFGPTNATGSQGVAILLANKLEQAQIRNFQILIQNRAISIEILLEGKYY